jgi:hypothetical protein
MVPSLHQPGAGEEYNIHFSQVFVVVDKDGSSVLVASKTCSSRRPLPSLGLFTLLAWLFFGRLQPLIAKQGIALRKIIFFILFIF